MNGHAPLFEETGDDSADQLVLKLSQACELLMQQNKSLQAQNKKLQQQLNNAASNNAASSSSASDKQVTQKIESLIQRLKLLEQEA